MPSSQNWAEFCRQLATHIREHCLQMTHHGKSGHVDRTVSLGPRPPIPLSAYLPAQIAGSDGDRSCGTHQPASGLLASPDVSFMAGVKVKAHPHFRLCVTMNDDANGSADGAANFSAEPLY